MRATFTTTLCLALAAGFWFCLTTTLDDMTRRDCLQGRQAACAQLQAAGLEVPVNGPAGQERDQ